MTDFKSKDLLIFTISIQCHCHLKSCHLEDASKHYIAKTAVIAKCPLTDNILRIKFTQRESDLEKDAEREGKGNGHKNPAEAKQKPAEHTDACVGVLSIICDVVSIIFHDLVLIFGHKGCQR